MRGVNLGEELEQIEFAKKAARAFKREKEYSTFGDIKPGGYLALRWGMGNDCVLVVKLDEEHTPTNYHQLVTTVEEEKEDED